MSDATTSGILQGLDDEERRAVLARMRRKRYAKGEVIFHEGDPGDMLHLIVKGHVSIQVTTPQGDSALLRVLGPAEMFGEYVLITPGPRNATVTALDPVETMCLGRDDFHRLRAEHPDLDAVLLDRAIREVQRLSLALLDALYLPVRQRVLRRLLEVAKLYDTDHGHPIPLSQADLAGLAGVTRQTTNRVLADAQEAGALRLRRGSIEILDPEALARRAK
ncbi:MAG: Crp/Fnr family transcriptional regulator [Acidimicrobiia bacterium]